MKCDTPKIPIKTLLHARDAFAPHYNDPIIQVGASEAYEARCRHCHEVPGKPKIG